MTDPELVAARVVYRAIQDASNGTDRSKQQQSFMLGVSNFGHCREYARRLMLQQPTTDERDATAAFVGTVLGDAIERQMKKDHPDWLFQHSTVFRIPSGGKVGGHPDIVIPAAVATDEFPQGVWDLKSKDGLDIVKRYGQNQQQRFQLHCYAKALIDEGILDDTKPIWLCDVYYDRSAKTHEAFAIGEWYDPVVIEYVDDWINDVKYAVLHNEETSRDKPREFCASWCEYFTACRGQDTDVQGLIEDPEVITAVDMYQEALDMERTAKRLKNSAQIALNRIEGGSTGTHTVRWVEVAGGHVEFDRAPYKKLSITPIRSKR